MASDSNQQALTWKDLHNLKQNVRSEAGSYNNLKSQKIFHEINEPNCDSRYGCQACQVDWIIRPQMWPSGLTLVMTLTLNFQGQIWNLPDLIPKWSNCHETKSKRFNWSLCLIYDHQVWPLTFGHLDIGFSRSDFVHSHISGMGELIDIEQNYYFSNSHTKA